MTDRNDTFALKIRMNVADEMLDRLINDIGTGPGVASLRAQAMAIKRELRGLAAMVATSASQ
ncbi:MAG: hypothetical protein E6Q97_13130 [Desulfurellales bacterium]|nr:MAG: hypothetical protein E6Q97_13130 [Desulfurellales bacterium]